MGDIRPYVIEDENGYLDAVDLNMITRLTLCSNTNKAVSNASWLILIGMYYAEPIQLEFDSKPKAKMKFNELMQVWKSKDNSVVEMTDKLDALSKQISNQAQLLDAVIQKVDTMTDECSDDKSIVENWLQKHFYEMKDDNNE